MGFEDEEADTEPQREVPSKTPKPPEPDPSLPKDPINREVPKQSAALIVHDPGDGNVRLEVMCPEGTRDDNVPLSAQIVRHAMEYITGISQGDE